MLPRVLEPEVMDSAEEAEDYDAMDHVSVNRSFAEDLIAFAPEVTKASSLRMLDVGTGTGLIPIELCKRSPGLKIDAVDLSTNMLRVAERNSARAGFADQIALHHVDAKHSPWSDSTFDVVVSNSIVHHIPNPADALLEMWRVLKKGGILFVRDLARPDSTSAVQQIVSIYANVDSFASRSEQQRQLRQRGLFEASLHAALTPSEVLAMALPLGVSKDSVKMTSDRHWTLACKKP